MTYATRADLEALYGTDEITQRESMLPAGAVAAALVGADATINGYLSGRYTVPLNPVPADLPARAAALARYAILGEATTERARSDYEDVIGWLKDVAAGRVTLPQAQVAASTATGGKAATRTRPRIFGAEDLEGY